MHLRTRTWFIISLLCFLAALVCRQLAERKAARDKTARDNAPALSNAPAAPAAPALNGTPSPKPTAAAVATGAGTNAVNHAVNDSLLHRLSNTPKTLDELSRSEQGILLR